MFVQQVGATCDRVPRSSRLNASPSLVDSEAVMSAQRCEDDSTVEAVKNASTVGAEESVSTVPMRTLLRSSIFCTWLRTRLRCATRDR